MASSELRSRRWWLYTTDDPRRPTTPFRAPPRPIGLVRGRSNATPPGWAPVRALVASGACSRLRRICSAAAGLTGWQKRARTRADLDRVAWEGDCASSRARPLKQTSSVPHAPARWLCDAARGRAYMREGRNLALTPRHSYTHNACTSLWAVCTAVPSGRCWPDTPLGALNIFLTSDYWLVHVCRAFLARSERALRAIASLSVQLTH